MLRSPSTTRGPGLYDRYQWPLEDRRGVGQSSRLFATNSVLRGTEEFDDFLTRPNNTVEIADGDD